MLKKFHYWASTFKGALILALFSLFVMALALTEGHTIWAVLDAACVIFWVNVARKATKNKGITAECSEPLTDDQKQRIEEASTALATVLKEIDLELTQAAREKANVQSNQREDTGDGDE